MFRVISVTFACSKMDITPKKRAKVIALKKHTSMTKLYSCGSWCGEIKCVENYKNIPGLWIIVSEKK